MNRALYPADWQAISKAVRARSGDRCECRGECGTVHHLPEHPWSAPADYVPGEERCFKENGAAYTNARTFAESKCVLTVAHLCECEPLCGIGWHLKAMCQRCHLAFDRELHTENATRTRRTKKEAAHEAAGQGRLL